MSDRHVLRSSAEEFWPRNPVLTTPTRSLLLSLVPCHVNESTIRRDLEVFGKIRAVEVERVREGLVTIHFCDLQHAYKALFWIQEQYMLQQYRLQTHLLPTPPLVPGLVDGRVVWAHFTFSDKKDGSTDSRTTLMIRNIPNNYTKEKLLNMLDAHCIQCNKHIISSDDDQPPSSYDLFHLPITLTRPGNVGYGFVNMTSPQAVKRLYNAFHNIKWESSNSLKISQVSYATVQGLDAYKERFTDSRFPCVPMVFDPPRDGQRYTQAISIIDWRRQRKLKFGSFPEVS